MMQNLDLTKKLVRHHANPIGLCESGLSALLYEYCLFGTNNYLKWLLREHYKDSNRRSKFIKELTAIPLFNESARNYFEKYSTYHPAHALLTCGDWEVALSLLTDKIKFDGEGFGLLQVTDRAKRTALDVAVKNGDLQSVELLLEL